MLELLIHSLSTVDNARYKSLSGSQADDKYVQLYHLSHTDDMDHSYQSACSGVCISFITMSEITTHAHYKTLLTAVLRNPNEIGLANSDHSNRK